MTISIIIWALISGIVTIIAKKSSRFKHICCYSFYTITAVNLGTLFFTLYGLLNNEKDALFIPFLLFMYGFIPLLLGAIIGIIITSFKKQR